MLKRHNPLWAELNTAFGKAEEVPALLTALLKDYDEQTWEQLTELLLHQYTVYEATIAAVPYIVQIASSTSLPVRTELYITCGMIETSYKLSTAHLGKSIAAEQWAPIRQAYTAAMKQWEHWHQSVLDYTKHEVEHPNEREYIVAAWLAYHGHPQLAELLIHYAGGDEYEGNCLVCRQSFYAIMAEQGAMMLYADDPVFAQEAAHTTVVPAPLPLNGAWAACQQAAEQAGAIVLLQRLPYMTGQSECPHCQQAISVAESWY